jgi:LCP family protein required for cell wall assembly
MSDLDLDLLRAWPAEEVQPSAEVRAHARAQLERAYDGLPTPTPVRPVRHRFARRLAIAALAALVVVAGTVVYAQRQVDDRFARLKTVALPKSTLRGAEIGSGPVNVLVVGSDRRMGTNTEAFGSPEQIPGQRSDTIILLRLDGSSVRAVWIPRDLLLNGRQINATFNEGPVGLITAIKAGLGVTIDHYIEIGFDGFPRIVDEVGGVPIFSPGRARDRYTGLDLPARGCVTLNGGQALQWVRSRHLEVFENGEWTDASPRADLDRQARQQEFIRSLARRAQADVDGDPIAAVQLADAIIPAVTVDSELGRGEIVDLVRILARVNPRDLQLETLPVQAAPDGARVELQPADADQALAPFRGQVVPPAPPSGQSIVPADPPPPEC